MSEGNGASEAPAPGTRPKPSAVRRLLPWAITAACFAFLYTRIDAAAAREGSTAVEYLGAVLSRVSWGQWLLLMIPYSAFYFLVDSTVVWRVINWFNARVSFLDILPVRASTYILSILNEQVGKGAMAIYLHRREGVPGWQVGSSMLFIMFCEFYYLLTWALIGTGLRWGEALHPAFRWVPWIAVAAGIVFVIHVLYFRASILPTSKARDRDILRSFRMAKPWHYGAVIVLRSPALLAAVGVYTLALRLFGLPAGFGEMLGVLPLVFFGAATPGPMRAVAISIWVLLYPERPAEAAAFGLVMHNFFIFFNATIGLLFLRRANREILGAQEAAT